MQWIRYGVYKMVAASAFLRKALRMRSNKPLVLVDRGPWYRWAFERLGLEYRHEEQGREVLQTPKSVVFHHKISARDHIQGIKNLKLFLKPIHNILSGSEGEVSKNAYPDMS
jgi:transposase-like protein